MKHKTTLLLAGIFCVLLIGRANAQQADSCALRISMLTCGPGEDLYSAFGHIALRVKNTATGTDYVFNYGTFDFGDPHFYWKFTRGKLPFSLSADNFSSFMEEYRIEQRFVKEQVLDISCDERQAIWAYLQNNYLPQNRYYKYDYYFDNCSTRIRDIFANTLGNSWKVPDILPQKVISFRQIMNRYLANRPWPSLGINLLFGLHSDAVMTSWQIMFLPDYLREGLARSSLNNRPVAEKAIDIYTPEDPYQDVAPPFYLTPLFIFSLLGLLVLLLSFSHCKTAEKILPWVDRCLFFLTGLLGCIMLFMWFGTDHKMCSQNFNLLWAFPLNLVFSFFSQSQKMLAKRYAFFIAVLNAFLLLGWFLLPQQMPIAMIPLVLALAVRGARLYQRPLLPS